MLDTVNTKLREIYDKLSYRPVTILNLFIEQFGEENVDCDFPTLEDIIQWLNRHTIEDLLDEFSGTNAYGSYHIDPQDYELNGRGKPLLEYIPDLGILDYLLPTIRSHFFTINRKIIVHFPKVRVTNEFDKYIDIQDLYAKVEITNEGTMASESGFTLVRTTYPYRHFNSGYAHSHVRRVDLSTAGEWQRPCLGSGPIKSTIYHLYCNYDEQFWGLFTFELSKYVTIESVNGRPYIRLESVGRGDIDETLYNTQTRALIPNKRFTSLMNAFIEDYARKGKFKFKFIKGQYQIGESPVSSIINLSNAFIEFLNDYHTRIVDTPSFKTLMSKDILKKYIISEDTIYNISSYRDVASARRINGKPLFTFKGHQVTLNIILDSNIQENYSLLFSRDWYEFILTQVLKIINYYGKIQNQIQAGDSTSQSDTEGNPVIKEKPFII